MSGKYELTFKGSFYNFRAGFSFPSPGNLSFVKKKRKEKTCWLKEIKINTLSLLPLTSHVSEPFQIRLECEAALPLKSISRSNISMCEMIITRVSLSSSVVATCRSLRLLSVGAGPQLYTRSHMQRSSRPFSCLTQKLCWCQMSSRWQLDVGWSILTGSPVSLCFCLLSKATLTLPLSLSPTPLLSLFPPPSPSPPLWLADSYHQCRVNHIAAWPARLSPQHVSSTWAIYLSLLFTTPLHLWLSSCLLQEISHTRCSQLFTRQMHITEVVFPLQFFHKITAIHF